MASAGASSGEDHDLSHLIVRVTNLFPGVEDAMESVIKGLSQMHLFLSDAEAKQEENEEVKNWVKDLKGVALRVEDVIDKVIEETAQKMRLSRDPQSPQKLRKELKQIESYIKDLSGRRRTHGLVYGGEDSSSVFPYRRTSYHTDRHDVVGLEKYIEVMQKKLITGDARRSVISIVGLIGMGKKTLAWTIYNSDAVKDHFKCRAWVIVSELYNTGEILHEIAEQVKLYELQPDTRTTKGEELAQKLCDFLKTSTYLIVMSDVWTTQVWDDLKAAFPDSNNGSRILFTTRNKEVALHADPESQIQQMRLLSEDESWELFTRKVRFASEFQQLAIEIVKNCEGIPLLIVRLRALLSKDATKTDKEWLRALRLFHDRRTLWMYVMAMNEDNDLPWYLKRCLFYVAYFPAKDYEIPARRLNAAYFPAKDYEIPARRLIALWVAEGLVEDTEYGLSPEDVAETYLTVLINRNLIQVAKQKFDGEVQKCLLPPAQRQLLLSKAKEANFLLSLRKRNSTSSSSAPASSSSSSSAQALAPAPVSASFLSLAPTSSSAQALSPSPSSVKASSSAQAFYLSRSSAQALSPSQSLVQASSSAQASISAQALPPSPSLAKASSLAQASTSAKALTPSPSLAKASSSAQVSTLAQAQAQAQSFTDKAMILRLLDHLDDKDESFNHLHGNETNLSFQPFKHLYSFLSFDKREGSTPGEDMENFLLRGINSRCFQLLRVLDLEGVFKPRLNRVLEKLTNLRYLGLRWTFLDELPPSIANLKYLQTLDVKHTYINDLPSSIWKLQNLRHLYLNNIGLEPIWGGTLPNLQTLWGVLVNEENQVKGAFDRSTDLRKLGLTCRSMPEASQKEVLAEWVRKLKYLRSLRLKSTNDSGRPADLHLKSLSGLEDLSNIYMLGKLNQLFRAHEFPRSVTRLTLSASELPVDPMPTLEKLPNLRILELFSGSFTGDLMVCSSEGFRQLRLLRLWKLVELKEWRVETGAMPRIEKIEIRFCNKLEMLPDGLQHLSTLQKLKLTGMPREFTAKVKKDDKIEIVDVELS
ncbi:hypothetical protein HHK36_005977 [Tetracentron sinense]|uniref:Uncharacterized protein n=1 Tax=Tetracentron sinense TaxID=13715 RepID=A0A834ZH91_TETSI|nr:hypothetical protein HHK36_005977 [Tetracentron sinense]